MTEEQLAKLHQLIDEWAGIVPSGTVEFTAPEEPKRELPKDKRAVRTKSTGDRVYLVDETTKTKHWVKDPVVLKSLGFEMSDVQEVEDTSLVGYTMGATFWKAE